MHTIVSWPNDDFTNGTQNTLKEIYIFIYWVRIWTIVWTPSPQYDGKAVFTLLQANVLLAGKMVSHVKFIHGESTQKN